MKQIFFTFSLVVCMFSLGINFANGKEAYFYGTGGIENVLVISVIDTPTLDANGDKVLETPIDSLSGRKDPQNQLNFMKPDMQSEDYNFYDRKKISTPLMPRYDLDSAVYQRGSKKKEAQQKAYLENKYRYPARPRNQWEIGIQGGSSLIAGDITPDWGKGWGGGFTIRKAINYFFSLRFCYLFSLIKDQELKPRADAEFNNDLNNNGPGSVDYYHVYQNGQIVPNVINDLLFHNYKNTSHALHIDGILNLGNILYHKERTLVNLNLFFGVGCHIYKTMMDMVDKNGNPYNFGPLVQQYEQMQASHASPSSINSAMSSGLKALQTGNYTIESQDPVKGHANLGSFYLVPDFSVGAGLDFHVSKWVTLGLEERFIFNSNDNLEGVNWQDDSHPSLSQHYDHYFSTMVQLKFQIGKHALEPLWWLNPMDFTYKKLTDANPDKLAKQLFKDSDEDGVPDYLDKEPNTKKGCPVDAHGVILDSDKDGIPDCDDKEPFSPPGYPIDQNGVAIIPPNPCCDNDSNKRGGKGYDCSKMEMPGVIFDADKYYIDPAYYSALYQVAEKLQMCPDVKMIITGVDESTTNQKYNEQLAYNRATSVADYLVEKYGISRDRFILRYQGNKKSNAPLTPQEQKKRRKVDFNYAADGEKGESNPPAPHPGLKAGSNK
jgi:outer membrane protein OmpA-like peptidoglycan-associated protein